MQLDESEIREFKAEAMELLDEAEKALLELANGSPMPPTSFDQIFRCFHSVKGAAAAIGLDSLQAEVHALETFFLTLKPQPALEPAQADQLLAGCDRARSLFDGGGSTSAQELSLASHEAISHEFVAETREVLRRLGSNLAAMEKSGVTPATMAEFYRDVHTVKGTSMLFGFHQMGNIGHAVETYLEPIRESSRQFESGEVDRLYVALDLIDKLLSHPPDAIPQNLLEEARMITEGFKTQSLHAVPRDRLSAAPVDLPKVRSAPSQPEGGVTDPRLNETSTSIRVSIEILDRLMTLIGEMVLVRNQVIQYANANDDLAFINLSQRFDVVTSEMQTEVMKTRMQPIATILTKFQRVVRDLAKDLSKKIEVSFVGSETEVDRALLEAVKDPLMHIVRNACDHGIESPSLRREAGKSEVGQVTIRSYHEGGQVVIEVRDDGKGLNKDALLRKAIERNLISADQAAVLPTSEIYELIFAPGLSTADTVTNVSGRGVGMDVVKKNIERIGGVVEITSERGRGTNIRIKIPLTLAIIPAMIVRSGEGCYAIPQVKLVELVRIEPSRPTPRIELLQGRLMFRLRGNLLPVIYLNDALNSPARSVARPVPKDVTTIIVVSAESVTFGLAVDEVVDTADIVVKPLSKLLKSLAVYAGATVLGNGAISLIIDINGLASTLSLKQASGEDATRATKFTRPLSDESNEFLVVSLRGSGKHAIPLSIVNRMEEFELDRLTYSGGVKVMRYGNKLLPILDLHGEMKYPEHARRGDGRISVIVSKLRGRLIGLEVDQIMDVIRTDEQIDDSIRDRDSILGTLTNEREVLTVIDVHHVLANSVLGETGPRIVSTVPGKKILFAEDTEFFRRQITKVLRHAGYEVVTAENGKQALSILRSGEETHRDFALILSDIEMPEMNGFELAAAVRRDERLSVLPMVAITTRFSDAAIAEGKRVGFNDYLEKLNPDSLLGAIARILDDAALEAHG